MVVFTCNNCGDSVHKPKVEKHITYECKQKHLAVSFCCIDCLKDFNYETVKDHCQCITEDQKYSAKGFVPKPSSEKGKRKQAGWVDIVQSLINSADLQIDERQFLNIISKFDNVPRKKNKFQNFCFSTAPAYRNKVYLVDKVFDRIEAEYKSQLIKNSNNNENSNSIKDSDKIKLKETGDENIEMKNDGSEETQKKNIKKTVINEVITKLDENIEIQSEKKKKKKEKKILENNNTNIEENQLNSDKKSKKLKNKSKVLESNDNIKISNINSVENGDGAPEMTDTKFTKKEEKIKFQKKDDDLQTKDTSTEETQLSSAKKSKKSKRKSEELEANNDNIKILNTNSVENGCDGAPETTDSKFTKKDDNLLTKDTSIEEHTQLNSSKKSKKSKRKSEALESNNDNIKILNINSVDNGFDGIAKTTDSKLIKKEEKIKFQQNNNNLQTKDPSIEETQLNSSKKSKKSKRKSEVLESNNDNIKILNINSVENDFDGTAKTIDSKLTKREEKIKFKQNNDNLQTKDPSIEETQLNSSKKSKKSKRKSEVLESNNDNIKTLNINSVENGFDGTAKTIDSKFTKKDDNLLTKDTSIEEHTQLNSSKKSKKLKCKSEIEVPINSNCTLNINSLENGNDVKSEPQMSKKEKKELKKKIKFENELASVSNNIIETSKESIRKEKKRKLTNEGNEENEEPVQKMLKIDKVPQVLEIQNGHKFEWNETINQVLQSKKKAMSISKVMKRVMNEYHSLNKTTKKTEKELEKIFLKKLKKIKNVVINNDKVTLVT